MFINFNNNNYNCVNNMNNNNNNNNNNLLKFVLCNFHYFENNKEFKFDCK